MNRAYAGDALFTGCSGSPGAGNGIRISKPKSLDLAFNLVPRLGRLLEDNRVTALKMRP
jgi:hypothetical protein